MSGWAGWDNYLQTLKDCGLEALSHEDGWTITTTEIWEKLQVELAKLREQVRSAGIEEDRVRAHVADLAEALAAVQSEGGNAKSTPIGIGLEAALGVCEAFKEFLTVFEARLRVVSQTYQPGA